MALTSRIRKEGFAAGSHRAYDPSWMLCVSNGTEAITLLASICTEEERTTL